MAAGSRQTNRIILFTLTVDDTHTWGISLQLIFVEGVCHDSTSVFTLIYRYAVSALLCSANPNYTNLLILKVSSYCIFALHNISALHKNIMLEKRGDSPYIHR